MDQVWGRIESWLRANAPLVAEGLRPGATPAELAATERALGVELPPDVRAAYLRHDGQECRSPGLFGGSEWLALERICEEWKVWKDLLDDGSFEGLSSEADGLAVRTDWWHPGWIPLTYDGMGNHLCADCAPGPTGTRGQIVAMWHDEGGRPLVAGDFAEYLARFADALEAGEYAYSEEYGGLMHRDSI